MTSVGEDFPNEQARVREIQANAREIGKPGEFLVAMCETALQNAEKAIADGDPTWILRAYDELRSFKE